MYLVTVKIPKDPDHDPHNKVTGECPVQPGKLCTDVTGQHHTTLQEATSLEEVLAQFTGLHVTRVEEV